MFPHIRPTKAVIHSEHLKHNLKILKSFTSPNVFFCPMVKANAYGHGDADVARILHQQGVGYVGVGLIEEGIFLRETQFAGHIVVFGAFNFSGLEEMIRYNLIPVISSWSGLKAVKEIKSERAFSVHIKFDTGMRRLGFKPEEAGKVYDELKNHRNVKIDGVLTHFHSGYDFSDPDGHSQRQLREFEKVFSVFDSLGCKYHVFNSSALIAAKNVNLPLREKLGARPGISLYGSSEVQIGLKPVMSFRSAVVQFHNLKAGESVSYNATWKAKRDSVIGVVPAGYADGVHRILSNKGHVLFAGQKVPMVGNVCMDYFMIDITDCKNKDDHEVTIFGYDSRGNLLSPDSLAAEAQTISYEIFTSVSERVPKILEEKVSA